MMNSVKEILKNKLNTPAFKYIYANCTDAVWFNVDDQFVVQMFFIRQQLIREYISE